jgi:hypothetical protein
MLCFEDMKQDPIEVLKTTKEYHVLNGEHTLESTGENIVMYQDKRIPLSDSEAKYVLKNPITAYGSTLLSALIMHEGIVLFQLGDGDMKLYYQKEPLDFIIPSEHMYGNSTYSLSSHDAVNHMQTVYLDTLPDFIMLTTDGIMNSFEDRNDYQKLGFEMIKSFHDDEDMFDQELSSLIKRFAEFGSGDDCSIVYAILKKEKKEV